jgi:hypothetical protein
MGVTMSLSNRLRVAALVGITVIVTSAGWLRAQTSAGVPQFFVPVVLDPAVKPLPNPTPTIVKEWGPLPSGRMWGSSAGVDIGPDGHVWAYDRCGAFDVAAGACDTSTVDPIL